MLDYCIGKVNRQKYPFLKTPEDLFELLRMDPLDTYARQSSWVAEAISCVQQYINAVHRKLEPGFTNYQVPAEHLAQWDLYSNYPDWAAVQLISLYPENYITPFVRQRKTSLFKNLENDLNQTRLSVDSVQAAMRGYLQTFEQTCDLDVLSCYMDGDTPERADYYFIGRQRVQPCQYFWRRAQIELTPTCTAVNPAAWSEWQAIEVQPANRVVDIRPVFWNGRLCLVWAEWREPVAGKDKEESIDGKLDINLAFMTQNGQWSAPLIVHSSAYSRSTDEGDRFSFTAMVATVRTDSVEPKGTLGILFEGVYGPHEVSARTVHDVLMRPVTYDDGAWLDKARETRFKTPETVQHRLPSQVEIVSRVEAGGTMAAFLGLHVTARREGEGAAGQDVLVVRGFCMPTGQSGDAKTTVKLQLLNRTDDDPLDVEASLAIAGNWCVDASKEFTRAKGTWSKETTFALDAGAYGIKKFTLNVANLLDFIPPTLVKNTVDAAQFLSFNQSSLKLQYTRLNSQIGPELVWRANISVEAVLHWDTQFMHEPPPTGSDFIEPNGAFDGANGLFFWELFVHLPHLVATRLRDEERYLEAQQWLHYIFDPQAIKEDASLPAKPRYWRSRPLGMDEGNAGCEALAPADPDAIGYSKPVHFRILMFTEYVKNLMAWGDWYYRQLTRDSLVAAKLCYVQAGFLMGKAPNARAVSHWQTDTVGNLLLQCGTRPALETFEQTFNFSLADVPSGSDTAPMLGLLACKPFKIPINQSLLDLFAAPQQRIFNMRNNLSLDGKPLDIPLFSPATDPNQLLRDLAAAGAAGPRPLGGRLVVNAFRWRVTFEVALRAVQALQDYGSQVLNLLERRDRAEQEELQQNHLVELGSYAQTVQEQSIAQLEASVTALEQSRTVAQERADVYAQRFVEHVSPVEYEVMASLNQSKVLALTAKVIKPVGAVLASFPNVFGLANGGHRVEKITDAVCFGLEIASSLLQIDADKQSTTEGYRRRRDEWRLQRDQALAEVSAINAQIEAQRHAVAAALANLAQTLRANGQALEVYNFLQKRATNAELYGWMIGQLKALHYQAYDAVLSLCFSAQASLSAETGDYETQLPLQQFWLDQRHGLTAGEHLRAYLLRMEREYLQRNERRLELVKTVSLRQLFDDEIDPQPGIGSWTDALTDLQTNGSLEFKLTQLLFDRDHPGHYCRQISAVEIDLPVLTGPHEDVHASVVQLGSMTATKATSQSVKYLHNVEGGGAPVEVQFNLRSGQQIVLSKGIADNGLTAMKPDEGLLNPFENTGAVSNWRLSFPWAAQDSQAAMLRSLSDVVVRVYYTAKAGDPAFGRHVEDLVTTAKKARAKRQRQGASRHE
ncbi:Tc toxin subunit A-related protein [Pseudomonas sp. MC6]